MTSGYATGDVDSKCDSETPAPVLGLEVTGCVVGCLDSKIGAETNCSHYHGLREN